MQPEIYFRAFGGRVVAVVLAVPLAGFMMVLMTAPESPVLQVLGDVVAARSFHAFAFWAVAFALIAKPPNAFLAYAIGLLYSCSLFIVALAVEETVGYVANGRLLQPYPASWLLVSVSVPVFSAVGFAHVTADLRSVEDKRHSSLVSRLALNAWVTLFGVACSAVGVVLTIVPLPTLWHVITGSPE